MAYNINQLQHQPAAQYDKRRNKITCETLENLHNQSKESREFMEALRKTCEAEGIPFEY